VFFQLFFFPPERCFFLCEAFLHTFWHFPRKYAKRSSLPQTCPLYLQTSHRSFSLLCSVVHLAQTPVITGGPFRSKRESCVLDIGGFGHGASGAFFWIEHFLVGRLQCLYGEHTFIQSRENTYLRPQGTRGFCLLFDPGAKSEAGRVQGAKKSIQYLWIVFCNKSPAILDRFRDGSFRFPSEKYVGLGWVSINSRSISRSSRSNFVWYLFIDSFFGKVDHL